MRQLLRRGSGSDSERPTAAETVRFEDLKLGRNTLGIEHDQCPLKRFFGEVFSVIYDQYAGIPVKHVQVKVFQLQCLIPSQSQDTIGFWFAVRRKTRLCIVSSRCVSMFLHSHLPFCSTFFFSL